MVDRQVEVDEREGGPNDRRASERGRGRRALVATVLGLLTVGLAGCTDPEEDDGAQ